ncbi:hypothetical protein LXL04_030058 [Taraxacum kok-saghyz]
MISSVRSALITGVKQNECNSVIVQEIITKLLEQRLDGMELNHIDAMVWGRSRPGNPCHRVVYPCQTRIYTTRIWQTRTRHEFEFVSEERNREIRESKRRTEGSEHCKSATKLSQRRQQARRDDEAEPDARGGNRLVAEPYQGLCYPVLATNGVISTYVAGGDSVQGRGNRSSARACLGVFWTTDADGRTQKFIVMVVGEKKVFLYSTSLAQEPKKLSSQATSSTGGGGAGLPEDEPEEKAEVDGRGGAWQAATQQGFLVGEEEEGFSNREKVSNLFFLFPNKWVQPVSGWKEW